MVNLTKWAKDHQTYLKIIEGEPVTCKLLGYEEFIDKDNEDREKIRYFLEVGGQEKVLESQSIGLAEEMAKAKKGDWVMITRTGKGRATRYTVAVKEDPGKEGE